MTQEVRCESIWSAHMEPSLNQGTFGPSIP